MQQVTENPAKRPFPRFNLLKPFQKKGASYDVSGNRKKLSHDDISAVEKEALALQAQLAACNLSRARTTLGQLRMLLGMLGHNCPEAASVRALIGSAIAKAQRRVQVLEQEEGAGSLTANSQEQFDALVYDLLGDRGRKFHDGIDEEKKYDIAPVNDDGDIVLEASKNIDGKTLRRLLRVIKFHSLDTANKKKVLYDTFGAEAADEEGSPKDKEALKHKRDELAELHEALEDMEAYKAMMISRKYRPEIAERMIERNHEIIKKAHEQIDEVLKQYDLAIKNTGDNLAIARLKAAKLKMKKMLKEDVIDHVLLEQTSTGLMISGGVPVTHITPTIAGMSSNQVYYSPETQGI